MSYQRPSRKGPMKKGSLDKSSHHNSKSTNSNTSSQDSCRKGEIAASLSKFLSFDDDDDFLAGARRAGGRSPTISSARRRSSKSSPSRKAGVGDEHSVKSGRERRSSTNPKSGREKAGASMASHKPKRSGSRNAANGSPTHEENEPTYGEYTLNDEEDESPGSPHSSKGMRKSAKKLFDRAVRAASPSVLRRARSKSPGVFNNDTDTTSRRRNASPGRLKKKIGELDNSRGGRSTAPRSRSQSPGRLKKRAESPGRLKKRAESPGRLKKRAESPGRLKKRAESPGRLKKRAESPGRLTRSTRASRRQESTDGDEGEDGVLGAMLHRDSEERPRRRQSRSIVSDPIRRETTGEGTQRNPRSSRSSRIPKSKSVEEPSDNIPSIPRRSYHKLSEEDAPLKAEKSYSNMQDELTKHKVKRNRSMDAGMALSVQKLREEALERDEKDKEDSEPTQPTLRRANSFYLAREKGRRGKQNSIVELVQYTEDEIHSTSYFASNHVLVNRERMKRGLKPLTRNIAMDELARKSAEAMSKAKGLNPLETTYVGNVLRGESIRSIHRSIMLEKEGRERANLLNPYFQDFGVGTSKGEDGQLYMCQLFSERLALECTDTLAHQKEQKEP